MTTFWRWNSRKWQSDNHTDVDKIVRMMINIIQEEQTNSLAAKARMQLDLMKKVEELYTAYGKLAEKCDQPLSNQNDEVASSTWNLLKGSIEKLETQRNNLQETESENEPTLLSKYQIQVEKLKHVEDQLAEVVEKLGNARTANEEQMMELECLEIKMMRLHEEEVQQKKEEMKELEGFNIELKLVCESLQQKVESLEEELKQKSDEIEIIKPRLSVLTAINHDLDNELKDSNRRFREEEGRKIEGENIIRKLKKEIEILKEQKLFKVGALLHWLKYTKSRLGALLCTIGRILRFYINFFTAHNSFKNKMGKIKEEKQVKERGNSKRGVQK